MPFDLLLAGGRVVDPSQALNAVADVGIRDGRIAQVGPSLDATGCPDVREITGKYVCPGLIDLHGHWYEGGLYGVDPLMCLNHGVTTAVDAGSTGYANFPEFRRTVLDGCLTDVYAFVHISFLGLHAPYAEELLDLRYARPQETAAVIGKHRERAIGVKLRIGSMTGNHGLAALDKALAACRRGGGATDGAHQQRGRGARHPAPIAAWRHSNSLFPRTKQRDDQRNGGSGSP